MNKNPLPAHCFTQIDLETPQLFGFTDGQAVLYTQRSPAKSSPNEDCVALIPYDKRSGVMVIADGLGGQPGGETASKMAIEAMFEAVQNAVQNEIALREAIMDGIEKANRRIISKASGAATTLALVEIQDNQIRPYHIGDSMIMVCGQRGKLKLQSVAHSPVGYAVESGLLDQDEAIHHEERHLISNVVGAEDMSIEVGSVRALDTHDTVILASDGLFDNLYLDEIIEIMRKGRLEDAAARLAGTARDRMNEKIDDLPCHPDDLTFILFRHK